MKEAIIIAGANGSGKTTFSNQLIEETGYAFINADNIERTTDKKGFQTFIRIAGSSFMNYQMAIL